ncbi:MAG: DUF4838 domain-containing protein [Armatimonadota bacterium]
MKTFSYRQVVVCLLLLGTTVFARADALYSRTIYLPAEASPAAKGSAEALKLWLGKMTGAEFTVGNGTAKEGIFLATESTLNLPANLARLKAQESGEAFHIVGDGKALWIVGKTDLGLDRGVFYYLDKLGCRWLHPGEKWTVIPQRDDITLKINEVQAPAFFTRDFFGTGGFGRPTYDPKQRIADGWTLYKRQNLLGGTFRLGGHTGEAFNLAHKAELEAHPEYVAEVNGQRTPGYTAKLCYSNPGLQELFAQDRVNNLKVQLARDPSTVVVSVEPADGGGHCACAECVKLGSVSDRVFTLANAAARAVTKAYPGKYVNLLAYNEHAGVPAVPIEPNVIVQLAPYAFQRTGLTPHEMIQAWGKKHDFLGVYTYWCIPDWSRCLPGLSTETVAGEIRFWHDNNIKLHNSESTFCGGNMGPNWYLAARLMWEPARDEQAILDDYYASAFGTAKAPIRRMYDRWDGGFMLTDSEVGSCYRDLNEALALAKDPAIRARLVDMGRYVHFLRLWYEFQSAKGEARIAAAKAVNTYLWKVYDSNMVQSFRMAQLLVRDMKPHLDAENTQAEMWKDIPQHTDEEILALVADGSAKYHPLDFTRVKYTGALQPLQAAAWDAETYVSTHTFASSANFAFAAPPGVTSVMLKIYVGKAAGRSDHVVVTDPLGKRVFDQRVEAAGAWTDLVIPTTLPGNYRLEVTDQKNNFILQAPAGLPFVCTGPFTCPNLSTRAYFYVPKGLKQVAVYSPSVIPIKIFDPNGKPVKVERNEAGNALFLIDVPAGQDGKAWSFTTFKSYSSLRLLNAPNYFGYSPQTLMKPEDAK